MNILTTLDMFHDFVINNRNTWRNARAFRRFKRRAKFQKRAQTGNRVLIPSLEIGFPPSSKKQRSRCRVVNHTPVRRGTRTDAFCLARCERSDAPCFVTFRICCCSPREDDRRVSTRSFDNDDGPISGEERNTRMTSKILFESFTTR